MKVTVAERLILLSILPRKGNITTLKIVQKLGQDLSFSEEEHKLCKFVQNKESGAISWDNDKETVKNVPIGAVAKQIIADAFKRLNKKEELIPAHIPLYEKFVKE